MRFLMYNIRYGTGRRPGHGWLGYFRRTANHLDDIIRFMAGLNPDIVGLLEVDAGSYRTGKRNQAETIAGRLGHYHTFSTKYAAGSWPRRIPVLNKQGNAFLTRDTMTREKFHFFTKGMKRLVIELELENMVIFLVHLALGARVRHHQLGDLYDLVKAAQKPVMVAGDFNAMWGEDEIRLFMAATGLANADAQALPSFPSWAPKRHLDFILHSPTIRVTNFAMPNVTLSDHLPLVCDFELDGVRGEGPGNDKSNRTQERGERPLWTAGNSG